MASRKRQRREFEESALVHLDAIYRAALRLARDPADAQDLSQEVFLRAYRSFHQYERGTNCRAWLFKILKNAFINRERSMSQSRANVSIDDPETGGESWLEEASKEAGGGPEDRLLSKVTGERIKEAVERLPASFRHAYGKLPAPCFCFVLIFVPSGAPSGKLPSSFRRLRFVHCCRCRRYRRRCRRRRCFLLPALVWH